MAEKNYDELFTSDVVDVDGKKIGAIGQVYLDDLTGQPSWVTVKTGWFGLKETFVPLEQAVVADGTITVPYTEEKVKDAPRVDPDKHLDADEEAQLYAYYGIATVLDDDEVAADEVEVVPEAIGAEDTLTARARAEDAAGPVADETAGVGAAPEPPALPEDVVAAIETAGLPEQSAPDGLSADLSATEPPELPADVAEAVGETTGPDHDRTATPEGAPVEVVDLYDQVREPNQQ
ncbi:MAG: PRC-barrel domain-containing protein [Brooklawnia sp.]|jgi:sporulation protein YlmC with PRC-barrel domain